jgi:hypothetical protein
MAFSRLHGMVGTVSVALCVLLAPVLAGQRVDVATMVSFLEGPTADLQETCTSPTSSINASCD